MNKTLKISLISVGIIGTAVGVWLIFFKGKNSNGTSNDDNIFERVINRLYENDSFPLKLNSGGDRVKKLQCFLNSQSSYGLDVDGKFGPLTLDAVENTQSPFSSFKSMYPNSVFGEISEEYYNLFVSSNVSCETSSGSSSEQTSGVAETSSITSVVPTGGGNAGLQYAVGPDEFSFDGNNWN